MTVLITGGTGRLGRHIIDVLLAQGRQVQVVTRSPYRAAQLFRESVTITEWHPRTEPFPTGQCEGVTHVLHLMGAPLSGDISEGTAAHASHVIATQRLAAGMPRRVTRLVAASSTRIYPNTTAGPCDESVQLGTPQTQVQALLQDKEKAVYSVALRDPVPISSVAVRLSNVVDPSRPLGGIADKLADSAARETPGLNVIGLTDTVRLFVWLLDRSHVQGPVNAVTPRPASATDIQAIIAANRKEIASAKGRTGTGKRSIWGSLTHGLTAGRFGRAVPQPLLVPAMALHQGFTFTAQDAAGLIARACPNPHVHRTDIDDAPVSLKPAG